MNIKEAEGVVGGLSEPSKMPGHGYSLPAEACQTGSRLKAVKGAVCQACYARKGRYVFPNVQTALRRRLASLEDPRWMDAMGMLLWRDVGRGLTWFRWHDSGDLQSPEHLRRLLALARAVPEMRFWLPTLEVRMVASALFTEPVPDNMSIRLSTPMIDGQSTPLAQDLSAWFDGVTLSKAATRGSQLEPGWFECPAVKLKTGKCGECRACWDRAVKGVVYYKH